MCIAAVLLSLIPVLSGYAVYLAFAAVITRGSPEVRWAVGLLLAAVFIWALTWAARRIRRRYAARAALDAVRADLPDLEPPDLGDGTTVTARDPA